MKTFVLTFAALLISSCGIAEFDKAYRDALGIECGFHCKAMRCAERIPDASERSDWIKSLDIAAVELMQKCDAIYHSTGDDFVEAMQTTSVYEQQQCARHHATDDLSLFLRVQRAEEAVENCPAPETKS